MTAPDLLDPFHRELYKKLAEEINDRTKSLALGSAKGIMGDPVTVAEKYAAQTSYIKALYDVLEFCEQVEKERFVTRPKAAEPGED